MKSKLPTEIILTLCGTAPAIFVLWFLLWASGVFK